MYRRSERETVTELPAARFCNTKGINGAARIWAFNSVSGRGSTVDLVHELRLAEEAGASGTGEGEQRVRSGPLGRAEVHRVAHVCCFSAPGLLHGRGAAVERGAEPGVGAGVAGGQREEVVHREGLKEHRRRGGWPALGCADTCGREDGLGLVSCEALAGLLSGLRAEGGGCAAGSRCVASLQGGRLSHSRCGRCLCLWFASLGQDMGHSLC